MVALTLSACATGGGSDIPPLRSLGWFKYLDGADVRTACGPGSPDQIRLIYNGIWGEQVRDYGIVADAAATRLDVRVLFPENLAEIDFLDPLKIYRGKRSSVDLTRSDLQDLYRLLHESGFDEPAPRGLVLPSDGFYWIVAACRDGVFHFNAYAFPSPRFDAITFDRWLLAHDGSGVALNPRHPTPARLENRVTIDQRSYSVFDLVVGENGIADLPP